MNVTNENIGMKVPMIAFYHSTAFVNTNMHLTEGTLFDEINQYLFDICHTYYAGGGVKYEHGVGDGHQII